MYECFYCGPGREDRDVVAIPHFLHVKTVNTSTRSTSTLTIFVSLAMRRSRTPRVCDFRPMNLDVDVCLGNCPCCKCRPCRVRAWLANSSWCTIAIRAASSIQHVYFRVDLGLLNKVTTCDPRWKGVGCSRGERKEERGEREEERRGREERRDEIEGKREERRGERGVEKGQRREEREERRERREERGEKRERGEER